MKLVIPRECQVGSMSYEIVTNDWLLDKQDIKAQFSSMDQKIYLHTGLSPEATFDCLIHEIIHIANFATGKQLAESDVVGIGSLLTQALFSMGIEPDFDKMPEEQESEAIKQKV